MTKLPSIQTLSKLAELLDEKNLSEIELESGDTHIRIARETLAVAPTAPVAAPAAPPPTATPTTEEPTAPATHAGAVTSPMVGTVYLAPEPGAKPFVKLGDTVAAGQTLLIIEAMKTMNPIQAPKAGKLTEICVDNEQPVEFEQVLAIIE